MSIVKVVEKIGDQPVNDEMVDLKSTFSSMKKTQKSTIASNLEAIRSMRTKK